ncbi:MAG: hypothetical protein ABR586_09675 [Thermoplasmatota archaeon]
MRAQPGLTANQVAAALGVRWHTIAAAVVEAEESGQVVSVERGGRRYWFIRPPEGLTLRWRIDANLALDADAKTVWDQLWVLMVGAGIAGFDWGQSDLEEVLADEEGVDANHVRRAMHRLRVLGAVEVLPGRRDPRRRFAVPHPSWFYHIHDLLPAATVQERRERLAAFASHLLFPSGIDHAQRTASETSVLAWGELKPGWSRAETWGSTIPVSPFLVEAAKRWQDSAWLRDALPCQHAHVPLHGVRIDHQPHEFYLHSYCTLLNQLI